MAMAMTKKEEPKAKKIEVLAFQIEVETEIQWRGLLRREGLIIVDVYASWAGPCTSMVNIFKRLKVEVNDDRLWLAIACSDNIDDLLMFKDQSEPCWLFMGGGKPVRIVRGSNVPKLIAAIKQEFAHELSCIEGKARRNLVSIDDEDSRRKKAEAEAARLRQMVREEVTTAESLNELRKESSIRLMGAMELYTVLAIQHFLIEAGVVNEIKDYLMGDFKIEQEVFVDLDDDGARHLFRIPYEILDPTDAVLEFGNHEPEEERDDMKANDDDDDPDNPKPAKKPKKRKTIPVELPEGILGETLVLVLECVDLRRIIDSGKKPPASSLLQTADDYIQVKVGPMSYQEACDHAPYSLHAVYGKGLYAPGVWCPRNYDDKRFTMINYFPRFVTEVLMPVPASEPKYMIAIYPVEMAGEVMDNNEIASQAKDVLAQGKVKLPVALADEMLSAWNVWGDEFDLRKKALTGGQVFALSVDKRNSALKLAIKGLKPLHTSFDNTYGKIESAKIFQNLKIDIDDVPNPDEVVEKFLARSGPRVAPPFVEEIIPVTDVEEVDDDQGFNPPVAAAAPPAPTTAEVPAASSAGEVPPASSATEVPAQKTESSEGELVLKPEETDEDGAPPMAEEPEEEEEPAQPTEEEEDEE